MLFFISAWAIAANWFAYHKGFYRLTKQREKTIIHLSLSQVLIAFSMYLFIYYVVARFLLGFFALWLKNINPELTSLPFPLITGSQCVLMATLFTLLQMYFLNQNKLIYYKLWKNKTHPPTFPIEFDLGIGALAWFLSFPVVTILSEVVDTILKALFHFEHLDQNAVKFVKLATDSHLALIFALLAVLVFAPLIEEFLFRGVLQTYFKKKLGAASAILLSALLFALIHFSPSQRFDNVSLILSLFILGCFLGFLYERQGSLWAPISLHVVFNTISATRILFLPELS